VTKKYIVIRLWVYSYQTVKGCVSGHVRGYVIFKSKKWCHQPSCSGVSAVGISCLLAKMSKGTPESLSSSSS